MSAETFSNKIKPLAHDTKMNLVIVDDRSEDRKLMNYLAKLIGTASHPKSGGGMHFHLWLIAQGWECKHLGIPSSIRTNVKFCVFFGAAIEQCGKQFLGDVRSKGIFWKTAKPQRLKAIIQQSVTRPYHFILVNRERTDEEGRAHTIFLAATCFLLSPVY